MRLKTSYLSELRLVRSQMFGRSLQKSIEHQEDIWDHWLCGGCDCPTRRDSVHVRHIVTSCIQVIHLLQCANLNHGQCAVVTRCQLLYVATRWPSLQLPIQELNKRAQGTLRTSSMSLGLSRDLANYIFTALRGQAYFPQ